MSSKHESVRVETSTMIHHEGARTHIVKIYRGDQCLIEEHGTCNRDEDSPDLPYIAELAMQKLEYLVSTARENLKAAGLLP